MSTRNTEFMDSLPRGPLVQRIGQVRSIALLLPEFGRVGYNTETLLTALEHSLREIARYTAETPYHSRATPSAGTHESPVNALDYRNPLISPEAIARLSAIGASFRESVQKGLAQMNDQLARARNREMHLHATLDTEAYAKRQYEIKIKGERTLGLAFVQNYAREARREIRERGLDIPRV